jgi:UDP-N-acetyl-D-mannosaminuronic acid transferase (WecB/TagA/CpsF family)
MSFHVLFKKGRTGRFRSGDGERRATVMGIAFLDGTVDEAVGKCREGGLVVLPSAPVLVAASRDIHCYRALAESDLAVPDSGYMTLTWKILSGRGIRRISGLELLTHLLSLPELREEDALYLVNPTAREEEINRRHLSARGIEVSEEFSSVAPLYGEGPIEDRPLRDRIDRLRPRFILINIGGGVQERLGHYLIGSLSYRPAILCSGAAIAFLTGEQAPIPRWADRLFLGWLLRCMRNPSTFIPRYLASVALAPIIWSCGRRSPHDLAAAPPPGGSAA